MPDTDQKIQPALTAEEFDDFQSALNDGATAAGAVIFYAERYEWAKVIFCANHALPDDDPRKITRADVECLKLAAGEWEHVDHRAASYSSLPIIIAKLNALLPP